MLAVGLFTPAKDKTAMNTGKARSGQPDPCRVPPRERASASPFGFASVEPPVDRLRDAKRHRMLLQKGWRFEDVDGDEAGVAQRGEFRRLRSRSGAGPLGGVRSSRADTDRVPCARQRAGK